MTIGFSKTTVDIIHLPTDIPPYMPFAIDDCSLAFHLGFRNKTFWWTVNNKKDMYKVYRIPKKRGGIRLIHAPEPVFKVLLQQMLIKFLVPLQDQLGEHVTAYRKDLSCKHAVMQHIAKCPVCDSAPKGKTPAAHECPRLGTYIHMDLENFFGNTQRTWIRNFFKNLGYSHYVASLMANLLTVDDIPNPHYDELKKAGKSLSDVRETVAGVPQGSPASGAICNIIANDRLDKRMLEYMDELNKKMGLEGEFRWRYTRYSDDLSFTCGKVLNEEERDEVIAHATQIIQFAGYRVNLKKTRAAHKYYRKMLLGMVFNQKPNIERQKYLRLRAITHNCLVNGFETEAAKAGKTKGKFISWLRGNINYVGQVHEEHGQKLLLVYEAALKLHEGKAA